MVIFHSYVSFSEGIHLCKLSSARYSLKPPARYSPLVIMMMIIIQPTFRIRGWMSHQVPYVPPFEASAKCQGDSSGPQKNREFFRCLNRGETTGVICWI